MKELLLEITDQDRMPPYEQLRQQLVAMIATGSLVPGDRLPPVRQLAGDLGLAPGTVARTYKELEGSGHVVSRRGAGTRVAAATQAAAAATEDELHRRAEEFMRSARLLGADLMAAEQALRAAWRTGNA